MPKIGTLFTTRTFVWCATIKVPKIGIAFSVATSSTAWLFSCTAIILLWILRGKQTIQPSRPRDPPRNPHDTHLAWPLRLYGYHLIFPPVFAIQFWGAFLWP
ncbi:hypothetical protein BGX38DRAFT_643781 [Terfezia claveryi]|nr:hypothetical protein BGX38DRAFT_643781 [Terfezia claveryi]